MQHRVGRPAERHHHGDGVLERLLGEDVAGGDAAPQQFDDGFPAVPRECVAATIGRRGGGDWPGAWGGLAIVLGVYIPPHAPSPGQMARSIASTSARGIRPRAHAPTASNASMMVTSRSLPSDNLARPGRIVPA